MVSCVMIGADKLHREILHVVMLHVCLRHSVVNDNFIVGAVVNLGFSSKLKLVKVV